MKPTIMKITKSQLIILLLFSIGIRAQSCNCDITLTGLSSTSVNLIYGNTIGYSPGDTICVPSGNYAGLRFYDINGTETDKVTIINCGGKVTLNESSYDGIAFQGCSNVQLTGSGDTSFDYGFDVIGTGSYGVGVYIKDLSTDVELDHVEISTAGFAGIMAKTDPICSKPETWRRNGFILKNLNIHHNYIHNTGGEGIYVGFTGGYKVYSKRKCDGDPIFGHWLENVDIHNNIVEDAGWDAIQLNLVRKNGKIRDNYVYNYGLEQKYYQNFGMSIGGGEYEIYNNEIINGPLKLGQGLQIISGQSGTKIYNNVIVDPKFHGLFLHNRHEFDDINEGYYIANNTIIRPEKSGVFYNSKITETEDPLKLYSSQEHVPTYFVNNLIVDPGNDYENGNTWKQNNESYFDFNSRITRDSLLTNIYSNIITRDMDTLGLVDSGNNDFHINSQVSSLLDTGSDVSSWGLIFDKDNQTRPSGVAYDIGAYEFQTSSNYVALKVILKGLDDKVESNVVYPNPARISFKLENEISDDASIQLIDTFGVILYESFYKKGSSVNVESYKPGLYFVRLQSNEKIKMHRLIIK